MEDKIESVAQAASPAELAENLDKLSKLAQELPQDKRRGDNKAVQEKLREMGHLQKAIKDQGTVPSSLLLTF